MKDQSKTKQVLIQELVSLRQRTAELEKSELEQKRAEEALRESESSMRAITDSAQDAILMMDSEGRISYWNPAAERILGYTSAEAIAQNLHALMVPSRYHEAHDAAFPVFQQKGQGAAVGKTLDLEARRKDGKEISVQLSLSAIHMKGAWHAMGVLRDSTEQKRAEETLWKSEERFRTLADSTFEGIIIHDKGEILDVKQSFLQMIGYESDEVIGKNMFDFVAPELRELVVRHVQTGSDEAIEIEVVRKDGTPLTMEAAGKTITHKDKPARVVALHNITERKRAEDALRDSEGKHKLLFDSAGDAIFIHDTKAHMLAVNQLACERLGYTHAELMSMRIDQVDSPVEAEHAPDRIARMIEHGHLAFETVHQRKDGSLISTDVVARRIIWDGRPAIMSICRDITERKEIEAGLEKTRKELAVIKIAADEVSEYAESLINTIREPLIALDQDLRVVTASRSFFEFFKVNPKDTLGQLIYDLGNKQWDIPKLRELLETILPEKATFDNYEVEHDFATIGRRTMLLNARQIQQVLGKERIILLAIEDITERKRAEGALEEALRESESLSKSLIDYMHDAVLILDWDGSILFANREAAKIIEFERPEEFIGHNMVEYLHPDSFQKAAEDIEAVKADKMGFLSEYQLNSVTGRRIWVESIGGKIIFRNASANLVCIRDITERKRAEEVLRESEERFRRIFDEGPFGMGLEGPDHTILAANKVLCELLGYTEQELAGQSIANITCEEDREKSKELLGQLFAGSIPVYRLEKRYVRKDGGIVWANITVSAIHGKEGNALYGLVIIENLTDSRKAAEKIRLLHYYDSLTGLPNRTFHKELIKRSIEHAQRHKEIFAIIYIGLDNFQRINDTLGHSIGDLLLKAVADRIANSMRKSDYVARSTEGETVNIVSRVGGDEFIVLAHDITQSHYAAKTSRRLLEELSAPYDLNGREVFITVSIGIALYPDDGADVDDLLKNAEKAMRYTKSEGKNNYHFYSSSMHTSVLELLTLENDLRRALERNELLLYYQPKVDAATRMVKGMEALIRWKHPDRGLIPPMQFIPMAETSGLIIPIGEFVIRTVCKQIKIWQEAGYKQINIALNVSSHQFEKQNLIEIIKAALQDTMISPQCLEVEITESTIMRNPEKAIQILMELKAMGLRILIDDFGTGFSSLSYLKRLPLDFLKIDQSFVKGVTSDPRDQTIVRTTIAMAHSLNLKTIAEGVETEEQLHFLQEHGCDEIQGYLFSRPLPAEEIPGILAKGYL